MGLGERFDLRTASRSCEIDRLRDPACSGSLAGPVAPEDVLDGAKIAEVGVAGALTIREACLEGPVAAVELPLALAFEHELRLEILSACVNIEGDPGLLFSSTSRGRFRESVAGVGGDKTGFDVESRGLDIQEI